ncbi:hypothetical protein SAMN05444161_4279 [Rhizobiales bacterium GAS191]|nr:hypothetical protein SAMN05444161_4279 [Rhizobiales bacterium GAS191]
MSMITRFRSSSIRSVGLALAAGTAIMALQPSPAMAQFWGYGSWYGAPRPWAPAPAYPRAYDEDRLRPSEIVDLLRGHGWAILSPPTRSGQRYMANVRNGYGQRMFVVLDAYDGRLLSTRMLDERPDTNRLAAIPGESDDHARPILPGAGSATPAPRKPRAVAPQIKRVQPPAAVKATPLAPPDTKDGAVAVAKPTATQPATKPALPLPSTVKGTPDKGTPDSGQAPVVRQVYPDSGAPAASAPATPKIEPTGPAPAQAASATLAPAEASPAPVVPAAPAPATPAKPAAKAALPPDAGYE